MKPDKPMRRTRIQRKTKPQAKKQYRWKPRSRTTKTRTILYGAAYTELRVQAAQRAGCSGARIAALKRSMWKVGRNRYGLANSPTLTAEPSATAS